MPRYRIGWETFAAHGVGDADYVEAENDADAEEQAREMMFNQCVYFYEQLPDEE